ncbi:MAG TPA: hypothetical protein VNK52_05110 [Hyphomicrobiaceae bacterium]|nr:hypothetical protein [Hyphomicrobiaceae bacterium]
MLAQLRVPTIALAGALALAGCANMEGLGGGGQMTTASVPPQPKIDPSCVILASQIDSLRDEGVPDKIAKAAANKYKMKTADLVKADQLTKANAEFQAKCSTLPPRPQAESAAAAPSAAGGPPVQTVAKATTAKPSTSAP